MQQLDSSQPDAPAAQALAQGDADLVARACAGDVAGFEAIMRRHNRLMFRTARSILRSDADAEDAVQEAYLKAWKGLASFRAEARLSTWLVRIAMNEAFSRLRRSGAQVVPIGTPGDEEMGGALSNEAADEDTPGDPERAAIRGQMRRVVEAQIDLLPEQFRTVFVLRAVQEMTVEEVAEALRVPPATVRTRFFRARALLRAALASEVDFATEDAFSFDGARCDRIAASVLHLISSQQGEK